MRLTSGLGSKTNTNSARKKSGVTTCIEVVIRSWLRRFPVVIEAIENAEPRLLLLLVLGLNPSK